MQLFSSWFDWDLHDDLTCRCLKELEAEGGGGGEGDDEDDSFRWLKEMGVQDKIKKPDGITIKLYPSRRVQFVLTFGGHWPIWPQTVCRTGKHPLALEDNWWFKSYLRLNRRSNDSLVFGRTLDCIIWGGRQYKTHISRATSFLWRQRSHRKGHLRNIFFCIFWTLLIHSNHQ